jgi:hypothetical protein
MGSLSVAVQLQTASPQRPLGPIYRGYTVTNRAKIEICAFPLSDPLIKDRIDIASERDTEHHFRVKKGMHVVG